MLCYLTNIVGKLRCQRLLSQAVPEISILFYLSYGISIWKFTWSSDFLKPRSSPNILQNVSGAIWNTVNIGIMYHQQNHIYA